MNKILCSLLVIAVLGTVQCESFKRVHFDQGRAHFERNLEAAATIGRQVLTGSYSNQTVVAAKLDSSFLANNTKDATVNTTMTIFLHASESGFCSSSDYFVRLDCSSWTSCSTTGSYIGIQAGKMRISGAYQINNDTGKFIVLDNANETAWKLTTRPVVSSSISFSGEAPPSNTTYGWIGLGTQDNAKNNFGTPSPVFSLKVNATGKGSLIFGNDTTLIPTNRKDKLLTWNVSANWIGDSTACSSRYFNVSDYKTKVYFDVNQVGTSISSQYFSNIRDGLNLTYNSTGGRFNYYYNATAKGPINKLSPIYMTIGGSNVSIPLEAFFRKVEDPKNPNLYTFMAESVIWENNYNISGSPREEMTIFGTHFLSNFYTVFSAPEGKTPFVTLHPTFTAFGDSTSTGSGGSGGKFLIGLIAVIGLGAVGFIVFRNKAASKLQEHLNEK